MKLLNLKQISRGLAPPILVLMGSLLGAGLVHAITPSGTTISNTASVDYEDSLSNSFTAVSETSTVNVGAVYAATIGTDKLLQTAAANTTKSVQFVLTNNANAADTFTLNFGDDNGAGSPEDDSVNAGAGSDIDATSYQLYHDINQNGVVDGPDTPITNGGTLTLNANDGSTNGSGFPANVASLVLQVVIGSASNNDEIGAFVTAESTNTTVQDLTAGAAADGFGGYDAGTRDGDGDTIADGDESVQTLITISANALLDISKTATLDAANNRINYKLTVANNGAATANDIRLVDMIPTNATYAEFEQINLSTAQGDRFWDSTAGAYRYMTVGQDASAAPYPVGGTIFMYDSTGDNTPDTAITPQTITEPVGIDLNDDGITGGSFTGIEFLVDHIDPTVSRSVVYTVSYDPYALGAGTPIENTFCVRGDLDNDSNPDAASCSNTVTTSVPSIYGVSADDTGGDGTPDTASTTDDEDATDNDTQHESTAVAGEVVRFTNVITNNGNTADSFNLSMGTGASNTFPDGTTFAYFLGGSPIGTNTGSINAGSSVSITVRATLPSVITDGMATVGGVATVAYDEDENLFYIESGTDGGCTDTNADGCFDGAAGADSTFDTADDEVFFATLTATSANDPAVIKASDTKNESLGSIKRAVVDLANSTVVQDVDTNADAPTDLSDGIIDDGDATDDKSVNQVAVGTDGGDAEDDIITTTTSAPDNTVIFPLYIANELGISTPFSMSLDTSLTTLPSGWTLAFRPLGGGSDFTTTPASIAPGTEYALEAVITIPALAAAGNYDFAFKATSNANSAISDIKVDRITVSAICNIDEGTGGTDQIQPLGTVDYVHTVTNSGNEAQSISLSTALSVIAAGANGSTNWTATIRIDTDDDGDVDATYNPAGNGTLSINDSSASALATVAYTAGVFTLDPGDSVTFEIRVFAPSAADLNDQIRATTTISGGCEAASIVDDTTVALQVRIDKTVAVDPNCTCDEAGAGVSAFAKNQATNVIPGQCLIWRLTVTNEGSEQANNVVISDQVTPFSVLADSGSAVWGAANPSGVAGPPASALVYQTCLDENAAGSSCQLTGNIGDATASGTDTVTVTGTDISFNVGFGADDTTGGDLIGSNSAVGQFCVQVQ